MQLLHHPSEGTKEQHNDHVFKGVFFGKRAEINQHEDDGDDDTAADLGDFGYGFQEKKANSDGDYVRNNNDPNKRKR